MIPAHTKKGGSPLFSPGTSTGEGTAAFICEAMNIYCETQSIHTHYEKETMPYGAYVFTNHGSS